jgi:hypothetical protein
MFECVCDTAIVACTIANGDGILPIDPCTSMEELPMFLDMTIHRMIELSDQGKVSEEKLDAE